MLCVLYRYATSTDSEVHYSIQSRGRAIVGNHIGLWSKGRFKVRLLGCPILRHPLLVSQINTVEISNELLLLLICLDLPKCRCLLNYWLLIVKFLGLLNRLLQVCLLERILLWRSYLASAERRILRRLLELNRWRQAIHYIGATHCLRLILRTGFLRLLLEI